MFKIQAIISFIDESVARPVFFNDFNKVKQAAQRSKVRELAQSKKYERRNEMQKKNYLRKTLALVMAFLMIVTMMPVNLMAEPVTTPTTPETYDLVDQNDGSYLDQRTENKYYKVPNWAEASVKNKGATKWELADDQILRSVSIPSEAYETVQLNYEGYHEDTQGNLILDLRFTWASRADSSVWKKMDLYISKDLSQKIDWTKSYYYNGYAGKVVRFEQGNTATNRLMLFSEMVQGALAGNVHHTPIKLFLKNTKREDLDKIDTTIQSRIINKDDQHIYTKYLAASNKSNLVLEGYTSYTSVTSVPKINATNFRAHLMPSLRNFGGALGLREDTPDILSSQTSVSYHPSKAQLYVASQWRKGSTGANGNVDYDIDGDLMAYRLAFNKELADALRPDKAGFVGYIEPSTTSGAIAKNLMGNVTGFTKQQINIEGDMAYVIFAPQGYEAKDKKQVVTTTGGTNGFVNNQTTLLTGSQYTVTRLNVKSDALKNLYPTLKDNENNDFKPELLPLDFHSSMVLDNTLGMDTVTVTTTEDVVASENTNVQVVFTNSPSAGAETKQQNEANKLAIKIANLPIAGDLAVYSRGAAGSLYSRTGFTLSNGGKTYTSKLLSDVKIPKGSKITLFAGYGGNLINNSADIYIGSKKVASFTKNQATKSYAPRALIGTESMASTLLDRTQYMPALLDTYDTDTTVEGYTFINKQIVDIEYNDNASKTRKSLEAVTSKDAEADAKYLINGKEYPVQGKGLYKFTQDIGASDKLIKDAPISARAFHYDTADDGSNNSGTDINIKSAVGSDPVIAKVLSKVTFDLNGGKYNDTDNLKIKSFEGGHPGTGYKTDRQAANSPVIRIVPINKHFATDKDYKANGFEGTDAVLKDNTGADLTGDALALRKFPGKGTEEVNKDGKPIAPEKKGAAFLGWTTQKLTGKPEDVSATFKALTVATTADQTNGTDNKNYIFNEKSPVTKSIRVYAAYGTPAIKFHNNLPAGAVDINDQQIAEKVVEQAITEQNQVDKEIKLQKNYKTDGFNLKEYSLVGYSRNPKAAEPDANDTGEGFEKDLYLRDGDKLELTRDDLNNGIDLYAVWKKNYHVDVTKVWKNEGFSDQTEFQQFINNNEGKIYVGLMSRPAVGVQGHEVVVPGAVYRPVNNSCIKLSTVTKTDASGNKVLEWKNLPSYDENGHRISYIAVELTQDLIQKFYEDSDKTKDPKYADYGVEIIEEYVKNGRTIHGHKDQLVNNPQVDAMSTATTRNHYRIDSTTGKEVSVEPHTAKPEFKYFETTGYSINIVNTKVKVQPPAIEDVLEDDTKVVVKKNGDPSELVVTLPGDVEVKLVKDNNTGKLKLDSSSSYTGTVDVSSDGSTITINLPQGQKFEANKTIVAIQKKVVGSISEESEPRTKVVKAKGVSNQVKVYNQKPYDSNGDIPVEFQVPNPPVDQPLKNTKYKIGTIDGSGTFTQLDEVTLDRDIKSDDTTALSLKFKIPAANKNNLIGKELVIVSEEPNKKPAQSNKFKLDLVAPNADAKAEDERWRRWVDINLENFVEDQHTIAITYTDIDGKTITDTFDNETNAKYTLNTLRKEGITNVKIELKDKFGNTNDVTPNYTATKVIQIFIREPRLGKNFVQVRSAQDNTKVVVNIYSAGTDPEAIKAGTAQVAHTVTATLNQENKFTKLPFNDGYTLTKGDYIEVEGTTTDNGRTNPYIRVLGD